MRVFFFIFILNIGITYSQVCYLGFSGSVDNICDIDSPNLFDDSKVSAADPIIEQILNEVGGSKRFIVTSECDDLNTVLEILSAHGLLEYIGSLKEIIDWEIVSTSNSNNAQIIQFDPKEG